MPAPTKAELAAAAAKLTEENKGLRGLLAAISLLADTVPIAAHDERAEWRRSCRVLSNIRGLAALSDWDGYLAYAAGEARAVAAEPVGYEVYVPEPEPVAARGDRDEACDARPYPAGSEGDDGTECALPVGHDEPHDDMPVSVTA